MHNYSGETCINLGVCHVQVALYLYVCSTHVSCSVHRFGTFSSMLHKNYNRIICIWLKCFPKCSSFDTCTQIGRGGVYDVERFKTNTYMTYLAYTLFKTCIKHDMLLTHNVHLSCLLSTCYSCSMHCAWYYCFNMHTTCILPLLQHACCPNSTTCL